MLTPNPWEQEADPFEEEHPTEERQFLDWVDNQIDMEDSDIPTTG